MGGSKGEKQAGGKQQAGQPSQAGQQQAAHQQQQRPPQEQWKHAVAGCTAGLSSVLVLHPLDVVKTRLQGGGGAGGLGAAPACALVLLAVSSLYLVLH